MIALLVAAVAAPPSCPSERPAVGGPVSLPDARQAWACASNDGGADIYATTKWGMPHRIANLASAQDCTEVVIEKLHVAAGTVCIEFITQNTGCELPVPKERWVTCVAQKGARIESWVKTEDVLLYRRTEHHRAMKDEELRACLAGGGIVDNCVHTTFTETPTAELRLERDGTLCIYGPKEGDVEVLSPARTASASACRLRHGQGPAPPKTASP